MTRAVLLAVVLALRVPQQSAPVTASIVDTATKAPVAGAKILLVRDDASSGLSVVAETDDSGRVEFARVPPGRYRCVVEASNYVKKDCDQPAGAFAIGETGSTRVSASLVRTGVITGRALSERGDPAPLIYVRAWAGDTLAAETRTNDLGEYRLFGLPPGSYVVSAERYQGPRIENAQYRTPTPPCPDCMGEGTGMVSLTTLLNTGGFIDPRVIAGRTYPPVYFPAALDRSAATPLDVASGAQVGGIEIRLIAK